MKTYAIVIAAVMLVGAAPPAYQIDLTRYFPDAATESQNRATVIDAAKRFAASPTPFTATVFLLMALCVQDRIQRVEEA
jgi:hypothetical protein